MFLAAENSYVCPVAIFIFSDWPMISSRSSWNVTILEFSCQVTKSVRIAVELIFPPVQGQEGEELPWPMTVTTFGLVGSSRSGAASEKGNGEKREGLWRVRAETILEEFLFFCPFFHCRPILFLEPFLWRTGVGGKKVTTELFQLRVEVERRDSMVLPILSVSGRCVVTCFVSRVPPCF